MSKITNLLNQVYEPFMAIIAYRTTDSREQSFYLEQHKISKKDGSLGVGFPLRQKTITNLFDALSRTNKQLDGSLYGVVPENVLYCDTRVGNEKLVWYRKPEVRKLFFTKSLEIPDGEMKVPGLVYVASGKQLRVLAFKGNKPKSVLYLAPFMNTDFSHVCLGNSKVKTPDERTFTNVINYWETMFWQSEFSHILGENPCLGNLATITKDCILNGKPFPDNMLKQAKCKLQDLLR